MLKIKLIITIYIHVHGKGTARIVKFENYEVSNCWVVIVHDDNSAYDPSYFVVLNTDVNI